MRMFNSVPYSQFALRVAICSMMSYTIAVVSPTIVDPVIAFAPYGTRTYPAGMWILTPVVVVGVLSYWVNTRKWNPIVIALTTFGLIALIVWSTLPNFVPGFPNPWVLLIPVYFGIVIGLGCYIHHFQLKLGFTQNQSLDIMVRIEGVKLAHELWLRILITLLSIYAILGVYIFISIRTNAELSRLSTNDIYFLSSIYTIMLVLNILVFLLMPFWEIITKTVGIRTILVSIKK